MLYYWACDYISNHHNNFYIVIIYDVRKCIGNNLIRWEKHENSRVVFETYTQICHEQQAQ